MKQTIKIEKIVNGGMGLGRDASGRIILAKHVIAGEEIELIKTIKKNNYSIAKKLNIITKDPSRIDPLCEYYENCGGCDFQHMNYEKQNEIKQKIITDLFIRSKERILNQLVPAIRLPIPSINQFHYRQRIRLQLNSNGEFCFNKEKSHHHIVINECLLAKYELNAVLKQLSKSIHFKHLSSNIIQVELLFNPKDSSVVCILDFTRKPRPADKRYANILCEEISYLKQIIFTGDNFAAVPISSEDSEIDFFKFVVSTTPFKLSPKNTSITLSWEAGGFFQVNLDQNIELIKTVIAFCKPKANEHILDLFCGMGNFSIFLAHSCKQITGIEGQGSAIRSAKRNSDLANLKNTNFYKQPIHQFCDDALKEGLSYDTVVIDPPRQGIPGLASKISKLALNKLIYISCDPATLTRDLSELIKYDFKIVDMEFLDMFPQTHHIESVISLKKC